MENTPALILNLVLAIICIWHIIASYLAKDKTKLWSPITFFSLTYLYYCVIPMFETEGFLNGISSAPYVSLFHFAALLSFVSILFGFHTLNYSLHLNKRKWVDCFNKINYKKIAVILFVIALACYIPIRGFRFSMIINESDISETDWDNQGLNYYMVSTISLFVTSCSLLIARFKENKILFIIIFWITLVTYIVSGFRYRIVILVISMFTTYYLYDRSRKIRVAPVFFVGFIFYILFNVMDVARSYGSGLRAESIQEVVITKKAGETDHVYNYSAIMIGRYQESGRLDYFDPIINAICFPLPRLIFPWKPKAEYAFEGSDFAMRGSAGSAYMGFVEAFMAFSWIGIVINGFFVGWLARRFWNFYRQYPDSIVAIITLAIFNGFTYVIVSRGYLSMQLNVFLYFICLPLLFVRLINKVVNYSHKC